MKRQLYILSADDDTDDQDFIEQALKMITPGHRFDKVNDGDKLLRLLENISQKNELLPDIIFLDLNMPFKSGREVLQIVKGDRSAFKDIHIVVLTTSNAAEDHHFCVKHGADSYLVKPNSFSDLITLLSTAIEIYTVKIDPTLN